MASSGSFCLFELQETRNSFRIFFHIWLHLKEVKFIFDAVFTFGRLLKTFTFCLIDFAQCRLRWNISIRLAQNLSVFKISMNKWSFLHSIFGFASAEWVAINSTVWVSLLQLETMMPSLQGTIHLGTDCSPCLHG